MSMAHDENYEILTGDFDNVGEGEIVYLSGHGRTPPKAGFVHKREEKNYEEFSKEFSKKTQEELKMYPTPLVIYEKILDAITLKGVIIQDVRGVKKLSPITERHIRNIKIEQGKDKARQNDLENFLKAKGNELFLSTKDEVVYHIKKVAGDNSKFYPYQYIPQVQVGNDYYDAKQLANYLKNEKKLSKNRKIILKLAICYSDKFAVELYKQLKEEYPLIEIHGYAKEIALNQGPKGEILAGLEPPIVNIHQSGNTVDDEALNKAGGYEKYLATAHEIIVNADTFPELEEKWNQENKLTFNQLKKNKQEEKTEPEKQEEKTEPEKQEEKTEPEKQEEKTEPEKQEEKSKAKKEEEQFKKTIEDLKNLNFGNSDGASNKQSRIRLPQQRMPLKQESLQKKSDAQYKIKVDQSAKLKELEQQFSKLSMSKSSKPQSEKAKKFLYQQALEQKRQKERIEAQRLAREERVNKRRGIC